MEENIYSQQKKKDIKHLGVYLLTDVYDFSEVNYQILLEDFLVGN